MRKILLLIVLLGSLFMVGCNKGSENPDIKVYTRDTTSGTRDGFFSTISFKDAVSDNTKLVEGYIEVEGNGQMISALKNDKYGIGYISLSSLGSSTLKGLNYNGVSPTEENVISGEYKLTRNFNYAIRSEFSNEKEKQIVEAFVAYMNTIEGKAVIKGADGIVEIKDTDKSWLEIKDNYPIIDEDNSNITIKFGGSTSVEKVAKALSSEFSTKCGNFIVEHEHTGSGDAYKRVQGAEANGSNSLHIGFASREFKLDSDEMLEENTYGLVCVDAIVVVVNKDNELMSITGEMLKDIYNGTILKWQDLK